MAEKENIEIVPRAFEAMSKADIPAFLDTLVQDIEWLTPGRLKPWQWPALAPRP